MSRAIMCGFAVATLFVLGCNPLDPFRVIDDEQPIAAIAIEPDSATLVVGDTVRFSVSITGANDSKILDRPVTWSVGNPIVATVSDSGLVTARAAGRSEVLATVGNYRASVTVTVTAPPPPPPAPLRQP